MATINSHFEVVIKGEILQILTFISKLLISCMCVVTEFVCANTIILQLSSTVANCGFYNIHFTYR